MIELSAFTFNQAAWLLLLIPMLWWIISTADSHLNLPSLLRPMRVFYPLLAVIPSQQKSTQGTGKSVFNKLLLGMMVSSIIISLAQPVTKTPIINTTKMPQAVDLVIVFNSSISMVLKDYKEGDKLLSRMQKAKQVMLQLVQQFKGERIALVVLGNPSIMWLPLTSDKAQVSFAIAHIQTTLAGRSNDVGAALKLVKQRFSDSGKNKKVVLLVDDAYLQLGSTPPIKAVHELNLSGFTLNTLAIGSAKKPQFSMGIGHLIYAPVDLTLLSNLAHAGEGKMVRVWQNQAVDDLLQLLQSDHFVEPPPSLKTKQVALFQYPLAFAILLLMSRLFPIHSLLFRLKHVD